MDPGKFVAWARSTYQWKIQRGLNQKLKENRNHRWPQNRGIIIDSG